MMLLALLPFVAIVFFLVVLKWPAVKAMPASLLVAFISAFFWGVEFKTLLSASFKGFFITVEIMFLILGAVLLLEILKKAGVMSALSNYIQKITVDHRVIVIVIAVAFVALIEGAAGFGTPAAVAAPILTHLGVPGTTAVSVSLIGDSVPTTYGALGTPIVYGIGVDYPGLVDDVSRTTAKIMFFLGVLLPFLASAIVVKLHKGRFKDVLEILPFSLVVGVITMVSYFLAAHLSVQLPAIVSGIVGIVSALLLSRTRLAPKNFWQIRFIPKPKKVKISALKALVPYVFLSVLLIFTGVGFVKDFLRGFYLDVQVHTFYPLAHPFVLFLLTSLLAFFLYKTRFGHVKDVFKATVSKSAPPFIALLSVLVLVQVLQFSSININDSQGMLQYVAQAIQLPGFLFVLVSPFVGIFGSFVAGSNTVSNLLFSTIQHETALNAGISPVLALSLQTIGGAVGNMIAIHNIIAASAIVGLYHKEIKILKVNIVPVLILGLLAGLIGLLMHFMV